MPKLLLSLLLLTALHHTAVFLARAQDAAPQQPAADSPAPPPRTPETIAKGEQIVARAVEALGGARYSGVRTVVGRGFFTPFDEGVSGIPSAFVDYYVYPDKERTEFRSAGVRTIQTNTGETGWIYDGAARTIKEMKQNQVEDFRLATRTSAEFLLRGWWRERPGTEINYVGRREAGLARRNEVVTLTHPDGLVVEYEFGARDYLPAKIIYRHQRRGGEIAKEEDRLAQFIAVGGVLTPFIIDHYRDGVQTSRLNYETIEFNATIPETTFQKPLDIKSLK